MVLLTHVLYLHLGEVAEFQPLFDSLAGVVRVYVHLYYIIVIDYHHAVAYRFKESTQRRCVLCALLLVDYELGAVAEMYLFLGSARSGYGSRCSGLGLTVGANDLPAGNDLQHALQYHQQTLPAGVHNARFLERREQLRGLFKALFALGDELTQELCGVAALFCCVLGVLPRFTHYGENGALGGLHYRLVRSVHAQLESVGELLCISLLLPCKALGKSTENERQNYAGVAPRTPQHSRSGELCGFPCGYCVRSLLELCQGVADGHGHIRSGVAVRHGEYIQLVNCKPVIGNVVCARDHCVPEQLS